MVFCRCRFIHDINEYLGKKPRDLSFPTTIDGLSIPVVSTSENVENPDIIAAETDLPSSIDPSAYCPVFHERGTCRSGYKCRYLGSHITKTESGDLDLVKDEDKLAHCSLETAEVNYLPGFTLKQLRSRKVRAHRIYCNTHFDEHFSLLVSTTNYRCLSERVGCY